jgi:hypothetical protein
MRALIAVVIAGCALAPGMTPAAAATTAASAHEPAGNPFRLHSAGPAGPATAKVQGRATKVEAGRAQVSAAGAGTPAVLVLAATNPSPVIPLLIGMAVGFLAVGVFSLVRRHRSDRALPSVGAATAPHRTASAGREPETEPQLVEGDRPAAMHVPPRAPEREPDVGTNGAPDGAERCRVIWCPDESGSQFRAVGTNRAGRRYVAARSPAVPDPRPPLRQPETLAAYEALVERLQKRGWRPDPSRPLNGSPWYAQSFQRLRPPPQQHAAAHQAGARH